jgi:hypothetical protein
VVTKAARCSIVTTYCGHGIGELFHTSPNVPHYPKNKAKGAMQPGHIFTIEPMINLGNYRCVGVLCLLLGSLRNPPCCTSVSDPLLLSVSSAGTCCGRTSGRR